MRVEKYVEYPYPGLIVSESGRRAHVGAMGVAA